jgi:methyl-accepting chemotaxis protein
MDIKTFSRFRRRRFFINKGLQSRFVIGFSAAVLVGFLFNLVLAYFLIDRELTEGLYTIHVKARSTAEIAGPILWKLGVVTVPLILAASAAIGYLLTRGIEVPLGSFRRSVARVSEGDFTHRLSIERLDRLSETFNSMTESLEERFGFVRRSVDRLDESCTRLKRMLEETGVEGSGQSESGGLRAAVGTVIKDGADCRSNLSKLSI